MNRVLVYDSKVYERSFFERVAESHDLIFDFQETRLNLSTASLAEGYKAICCFVNDELSQSVLHRLSELGVGLVLLRCAGFNNVDGEALGEVPVSITRVPEYSPQSVAEFALALLLNTSRKIHKSYIRTRDMNFTLAGLIGFDLKGKNIGVVGTGKIGSAFVQLLQGFQAKVLAVDPIHNVKLKGLCEYVDKTEMIAKSDIIVLHAPLSQATHHYLDFTEIDAMKPGCIIINTSRGGLINTKALISGLKTKKIGAAALDVYEEEARFFFQDFSEQILEDDVLARLMTFPNVIVTSHQGYLTENALEEISAIVAKQAKQYLDGEEPIHRIF